MNKKYKFNIENCIYIVNISNNVAKIYDMHGNIISDNIEIADIYAKDIRVVKALLESTLSIKAKKEESHKKIQEALEYLGIK